MRRQPIELDGQVIKKFKGGLGRWYEVLQRIKPSEGQTPYTPSVVYTRSRRVRPSVWKATTRARLAVWRVFSSSSNKPATVKSTHFTTGKRMLENESRALARLQKWAWLPGRRVAPKLYQGLTFDSETGLWFVASEWLGLEDIGRGRDWESLAEILKQRRLEIDEILQLQRALEWTVRIMHRRGVIHGDIKDEHVAVKVVDAEHGKYDFNTIRLFDFGLSYLGNTGEWRGASLGFCNPYFWASESRMLDKNQLQWLDWYAVDALLYLALTGECFPAAFPAYKDALLEKGAAYFRQLEQRLYAHFQDEIDRTRRALAYWLIRRLCECNPDKVVAHRLFYRPQLVKLTPQPALWFCGVLLGGLLLSRVFRVAFPLSYGLCTLALVLLRWAKRHNYYLNAWDLQQVLARPIVQEAGWATFWSLAGSLVLPVELLPALPGIAGLFVATRKSMLLGGASIALATLVAWTRLTIVGGKAAWFAGWPGELLLTPLGLFIIFVDWLLAYNISFLRFKVQKPVQRLAWGTLATLCAWLFPLVAGWALWISPQFTLKFWITGLASCALGVLGGVYAIWMKMVNVNLTEERRTV